MSSSADDGRDESPPRSDADAQHVAGQRRSLPTYVKVLLALVVLVVLVMIVIDLLVIAGGL